MPMMIRHIDAIAREKQRDVLYLAFHPEGPDGWRSSRFYDQDEDETRRMIIEWLDKHRIGWEPCGPYADVNVIPPYRGQIYIDVPYDPENPTFRAVQAFLENADGSTRNDGVRFYVLTLEFAMKNKEHDEPGFWERWAEDL